MNEKQTQLIYLLTFPIVLTIGIVLIPVVTDYGDHQLAEQAAAQTTRWFAGHIIAAIGFPLAILSVIAIEGHLRLSSRSLPVLTVPCVARGRIIRCRPRCRWDWPTGDSLGGIFTGYLF